MCFWAYEGSIGIQNIGDESFQKPLDSVKLLIAPLKTAFQQPLFRQKVGLKHAVYQYERLISVFLAYQASDTKKEITNNL